MAVALDASSPAPVYQDAANFTACTTASFTPPNGSIIVAKAVCGDGNMTISSLTSSGPTLTSRVNAGTAGASTRVAIYTGTGAGASITVTLQVGSTANVHGLIVEVFTGAQLAGTPATHSLVGAGSAPSDSITTVAANSVVSWVNGDWAAIDGTSSKVYRSSATQTAFHWVSGQDTLYTAYQAAASAGAQTYGLTAPTGQTSNLAAIEIQDSGGGAAAIPPILVMQPRS